MYAQGSDFAEAHLGIGFVVFLKCLDANIFPQINVDSCISRNKRIINCYMFPGR